MKCNLCKKFNYSIIFSPFLRSWD